MKIVSVMTSEAAGGAEFAAQELLDALAQRGHSVVHLVSPGGAHGAPGGIRIREVDLGAKLSRSTAVALVGRAPKMRRTLREVLTDEAPFDVLLVHFKKEQLLTLLLPPELRPATVWAEWGPVPREFAGRLQPANLLYRLAARRASTVLAISSGTADSLAGAGIPREKIVVLPNAVRTDEIAFTAAGRARVRGELGIDDDEFVVGCISRFNRKKANHVVVEATVRLPGSAHLIMAGAGETEPELRELARPLGERGHFLPTPTDDLADVLSAFDVSVFCPSPTEGAPRAVILAMLAERPVIATTAEGVVDLLVNGGGEILGVDNDTAALHDALRRYADDPARGVEVGRQGRAAAVEQHAAATVAGRLEAILEQAARRA